MAFLRSWDLYPAPPPRGWLPWGALAPFLVTGLDVGIPALLVDMQPVGPFWLTGGPQGPEASVVCLGYFILGIAAMQFLRPRA